MKLIEIFLQKNQITYQYEEKIFIINTFGFWLLLTTNVHMWEALSSSFEKQRRGR
jgi:hypothetical protein